GVIAFGSLSGGSRIWSLQSIFPARCCLGRRLEKQLDVAPQEIETFGRVRSASLRLRQDKAPLDHRLEMQSKALRRPAARDTVLTDRCADVGLECFGVAHDVPRGGGAHLRMRLIGLLNDRADKACEIG